MKVAVKLFAGARELAGTDQVEVELPANAAIRDLRTELSNTCPSIAPLIQHAVFAINATYATDETRIENSDEVACIPPVSGG